VPSEANGRALGRAASSLENLSSFGVAVDDLQTFGGGCSAMNSLYFASASQGRTARALTEVRKTFPLLLTNVVSLVTRAAPDRCTIVGADWAALASRTPSRCRCDRRWHRVFRHRVRRAPRQQLGVRRSYS